MRTSLKWCASNSMQISRSAFLQRQHKAPTGNAGGLPPVTINDVLFGSASSIASRQPRAVTNASTPTHCRRVEWGADRHVAPARWCYMIRCTHYLLVRQGMIFSGGAAAKHADLDRKIPVTRLNRVEEFGNEADIARHCNASACLSENEIIFPCAARCRGGSILSE